MDVPLGMTDGLGDGATTDDELQNMKAQRTRKHARLAAFGWDGADHPRVGSLVPPPSAKLPERDSRERRRRRRGGPLYVVGRSMFETDGIPGDWAEKCNEWVDEVWLPSEFNRQTFAAHGVDEARLQLMPQPLDLKLFDADAVTPAVLPHRPRFAFLSVFKWEKRKGWDALFAAFLREFTASEDVALFLRVSTDDGNKQELADALHAELCRLADDVTTEAGAAARHADAAARRPRHAPARLVALVRRVGSRQLAAGRGTAALAAAHAAAAVAATGPAAGLAERQATRAARGRGRRRRRRRRKRRRRRRVRRRRVLAGARWLGARRQQSRVGARRLPYRRASR